MLDPYTTLDVARNATQEEIKRAFRRLAKELHPDLNPDNAANARRFRDIAAAYDLLSDETKRRQYDAQWDAAKSAAEAQSADSAGLDEGLDSFFRARNRSANARKERASESFWRGADLEQALRISFVEAAIGTKKRIQVDRIRALDVVVPAGTQDGQILRLKGQGTTGAMGARSGDVLVEIVVEPHPDFTRKDYDIHMILPITVPEAVQGASAIVATIHGSVQLKIPKGANTDTQLRLRGKGIPIPGGGAGDHYVTLKVMLPRDDPEFARLVDQWAKRHNYAVRPA
jgi:DnaJ-class molecular chaperone